MRLQLRFAVSVVPLMTLAAFAAPTPSGPALTLDDSFKSALQKNEDFQTSKEQFKQSDEVYSQAKGTLFPQIQAIASYQQQEAPQTAIGAAVSPTEQKIARLNATQPIFHGASEYAALRQTRGQKEAGQIGIERTATNLFVTVTQAFYQLLSAEQDVRNLENEIALNEKRLKDVKSFERVGRSKPTDGLTVEANIATLKANRELALGTAMQARETFTFVTGAPREANIQDKLDLATVTKASQPIDAYLKRIELRPDIRAAAASANAASEGPAVARGRHFPNLDLTGNYWLQRPGTLSTVHWDVSIAMTMSIFNGGVIQSQVRQAASVSQQSELALAKLRRAAEQEIRFRFDAYQADVRRVKELENAVEVTKKNAEMQSRDYRLGLVTNLDVLQAMTTSQQSQRLYDQAKFLLKSDFLTLEAAAALRPEKAESI